MSELLVSPPPWKQQKNEQAMTIYAAVLAAGILLILISRRVHSYFSTRQSPGWFGQRWLLLFRTLSRRTSWKWFGQPSHGLVGLVAIFAVGNIILSQTILATNWINHYASRCGWLTAANMALCVFLGMKNTPLSILTYISHAELNILHRVVGYTACIALLFHVVLYTIHDGMQHKLETLLEPHNLHGIGAGISMVVLLMGIFRDANYRLFYTSHIVGFVAAIVLAGLHRPNWAKKLPMVMLFIGSMWMVDRSIRTAKILYRLVNNQVTLHPFSDGGMRLFVKKPSGMTILPGEHCFLWIPRLRLFHTHPFTVVSNGPDGIEFMVKSHRGFTKELYGLAFQLPEMTMPRVSLDGSYGSLPQTSNYDRVLLIAGGSGGAFTFGLMNRIMNHSGKIALQTIDFVWAVKRAENLLWFHEHLSETCSGIKTQLYVTSESRDAWQHDTEEEQDDVSAAAQAHSKTKAAARQTILGCSSRDMLTGANYLGQVTWEKMDVESVVREAAQAAEAHQRILVATCGPKALTHAVKDAVERLWDQTHLRVDVHSEDFST